MKVVAITGERQASLVDVPDPQPKENWALVKITVAPMCTEYKSWLAGHQGDHLGHEAVGEVVAVAQPGRVKPGDRVIVQPQYPCGVCPLCVAGDYIHCQHCVNFAAFTGSPHGSATYAQYLVKPDWLLSPIPDDVSDELAGLAICGLGPSFGAFDLMGVSAFDTVLITGLGPVGLGGVVNARYRGARVIAVEGNAWRAERARELGAELVLDPRDDTNLQQILDATGGRGADAGLDCSGSPQAQRLLIDAARRKGKVAFVGVSFHDTIIHITPDLVNKGLSLHGAWHYNLNATWRLVQVIQRHAGIEQLISHCYPMSQVQQAFETLAEQNTAKVMLKPWS